GTGRTGRIVRVTSQTELRFASLRLLSPYALIRRDRLARPRACHALPDSRSYDPGTAPKSRALPRVPTSRVAFLAHGNGVISLRRAGHVSAAASSPRVSGHGSRPAVLLRSSVSGTMTAPRVETGDDRPVGSGTQRPGGSISSSLVRGTS